MLPRPSPASLCERRRCDGRPAVSLDSHCPASSWKGALDGTSPANFTPPWAREDAIVACVGVAAWKRRHLRLLLTGSGDEPPAFFRSAAAAVEIARRRRGAVAVWPSREPGSLSALARAAHVPLVRVEDGFLRSRGLGAECRPPLSIVVDHSGVHFDPSRPSDLERLLAHRRFDAALTARAERLVRRIVALGLTKYNLAGSTTPPCPQGRTVLVAGQVEDDLAVRLGGAGTTSNLALLRRVRELEPDATILYRPHPDVEAGLRKGAWPDMLVRRFADQVVRDVDLPSLLTRVDAVHVLTSLTGFEALLRGRAVVCHGQPFYAGWGLTRDLAPPPRRGRRLGLAELAAATLILYPRYLNPETETACTPEDTVERLARPAPLGLEVLPTVRRLQGLALRTASVPRRAA